MRLGALLFLVLVAASCGGSGNGVNVTTTTYHLRYSRGGHTVALHEGPKRLPKDRVGAGDLRFSDGTFDIRRGGRWVHPGESREREETGVNAGEVDVLVLRFDPPGVPGGAGEVVLEHGRVGGEIDFPLRMPVVGGAGTFAGVTGQQTDLLHKQNQSVLRLVRLVHTCSVGRAPR